MPTVTENVDVYRTLLERQPRRMETPWADAMRQDAMSRFETLGFPSTSLEQWRYTSVAPIARGTFGLPDTGLETPLEAEIPFADLNAARFVFVDGRWRADLSDTAPEGVRFSDLATAFAQDAPALVQHFSRYAEYQNRAFVALNTAFAHDGALLEVAEGATVERPVHLVFISTSAREAVLTTPRTLVIVGTNARFQMIETYLGLGEAPRWTNAVTEVACGENAVLDHLKFQQETGNGFHVGAHEVHQERSSLFRSNSISMGGGLVRNDLNVALAGEGADCTLNGLYVARGREHVDNHTMIDHRTPRTFSRELYKGVLDERARAVFNGAIIVRPNAQKSAAAQQNRNLLLSDDAGINTKPELQIHADDIKCTHGATIGQLDSDALFYLRTRGFDRDAARRLLTRAFAADVLRTPPIEGLSQASGRIIGEWLDRRLAVEKIR